MKNLNQIPSLIGFGLGCVIIFISWVFSMVFNGGSIVLKFISPSPKNHSHTFESFNSTGVRQIQTS